MTSWLQTTWARVVGEVTYWKSCALVRLVGASPEPLPPPTGLFLELIACAPGTEEDPVGQTYVLRDVSPEALHAFAADLIAAGDRDDPIEPVLASWAAIQ